MTFLNLLINLLFHIFFKNFSLQFFHRYIKMSENLSAKYYQKVKKDYKKVRERCQILSKEENERKRQYGCERYKNFSEDEK